MPSGMPHMSGASPGLQPRVGGGGLLARDLGRLVDEGVQRAGAVDRRRGRPRSARRWSRRPCAARRAPRRWSVSVRSAIIPPPSARQRSPRAHRARSTAPCPACCRRSPRPRAASGACGVTEVIGSTPSTSTSLQLLDEAEDGVELLRQRRQRVVARPGCGPAWPRARRSLCRSDMGAPFRSGLVGPAVYRCAAGARKAAARHIHVPDVDLDHPAQHAPR